MSMENFQKILVKEDPTMFTGSTAVIKQMWRMVGKNVDHYRSYPRIVGETGDRLPTEFDAGILSDSADQ